MFTRMIHARAGEFRISTSVPLRLECCLGPTAGTLYQELTHFTYNNYGRCEDGRLLADHCSTVTRA